MKTHAEKTIHRDKITARKVQKDNMQLLAALPDSLNAWITQYLQLAVIGVRSQAVTQKIALQLARFLAYFEQAYGHDRISTCLNCKRQEQSAPRGHAKIWGTLSA